MKFVFDFDGVMTDQTEEALRVREIFVTTLKERCGLEESRVDAIIKRGDEELQNSPHSHGWKDQGRVSAYANEDLFMQLVGLASCLRELADTERGDFALAREGLQGTDAPGYIHLSQYSYETMVRETHQGKLKPVDPKMAPLFEKMLSKGHDITVVSNSSTSRILDLLHNEGLDAKDHELDPDSRFRVRGDARKFDLSEHSRGFEVTGYRIETARPKYERIIREEKPDAVTGDVFSLDLALPLQLTRVEPETFGGMNLFLRKQHYTPTWSKEFFETAKEDHAKLHVIDNLDQIAEILGL